MVVPVLPRLQALCHCYLVVVAVRLLSQHCLPQEHLLLAVVVILRRDRLLVLVLVLVLDLSLPERGRPLPERGHH